MSHECPCCGQWVRGENPLPPEQEQVIKDYVTHLADKANARKSALQSRVAELEAALENAGFDKQYLHDLEIINKRMETALRKIAYEIPIDISGDEASTMCEEIASEFFGEFP